MAPSAHRKYKRAVPFIKVLHQSNPRLNKTEILKKFPTYVTDDMMEILHNILIGKLKVKAGQRQQLTKQRKSMHEFENLSSLKSRRNFVYKQRGGFLSVILPIIASVLGGLFHSGG